MRILIVPALLLLTACPTPPEDVPGASATTNQAGGPGGVGAGQNGRPPQGANGGPGGAPGGEGQQGGQGGQGGQAGGQQGGPGGAPGGEGQQGGQQGGEMGENGPGGPPPEGSGGAPGGPQENGGTEGQAGGQGEQGGPGEAGGQAGQYPEGDQQAGGQGEQGGQGGQAGGQAGGQGGPPEGQQAPSGPVEGQLLIKVDREPPSGQNPQLSQDELAKEDHVTFKGTASCGDCTGDLVLRVVKFLGPEDQPSVDDLLTVKKLGGTGDFSILLPESEDPIIFELLVDENQDGKPSKGERFAVLEVKDKLPTKNQSGFELNASEGDLDNTPPQ